MEKQISTTALAKINGLSSKELFLTLSKNGFINKIDDAWALTELGEKNGGDYKKSPQYGKYIVWPETFKFEGTTVTSTNETVKLITATAVGKAFELSANKINFILSELGWVDKGIKGWVATQQGIKQGAIQAEDKKSGIPYVRWPEDILKSKSLLNSIAHVKGEDTATITAKETDVSDTCAEFRTKFEAKHRSADGHFVRSKAEMLVDNWLYMAEIVHAYERKLPIEEDVYCDFYIPTGKVYIEYWGYENEPKYLARKKKKIELYKKYNFNLIELQDKDVQNLDDVLPRLLLKFGVQAY